MGVNWIDYRHFLVSSESCADTGLSLSDHFVEINKMIGLGAQR